MQTETTRRLIVIIPEDWMHQTRLAYRAHWLAVQNDCAVLYMVVHEENWDALAAARGMATLCAITSANSLVVGWNDTTPADLLSSLRGVFRPGDHLACSPNQRLPVSRQKLISVMDVIKFKFDAPLHLLTGIAPVMERPKGAWLQGLAVWLGFAVILGLFSALEVFVDRSLVGAAGKVLLLSLVLVEFLALWGWNRLFENSG